MLGPVGVPEAVIIIAGRLAAIADRARQEAGPPQGTVEETQACLIRSFDPDPGQVLLPDLLQLRADGLEIRLRDLRFQIGAGGLLRSEGRAGPEDVRVRFVQPDPDAVSELLPFADRRLETQDEMAAVAGRKTLPRINAVDGVGAADFPPFGIHHQGPLPFIAVDLDRHPLGAGQPPDGGVRASGHLGRDARKPDGVIGGRRRLVLVAERQGPFRREQGGGAPARHQGEGAVILGGSAHQPVRGTEALEKGVAVVIGAAALELRGAGLGDPECLPVRLRHGGQGVAIDLRARTEDAGGRGRTLRRADAGVHAGHRGNQQKQDEQEGHACNKKMWGRLRRSHKFNKKSRN